ncbi:phage holin family protein [Brevibacillus sp. LEMMJ03]|uniref:phage holin family protein n=1 Tax=Brevibacillus sp. LEMMJ03 TaxID=2595056 RepID=UPI0005D109DC|nr:phage holin family protein [Brevibacillus sp. LEMMJ03]TRY24368.1 phage holin family protein [Brevibacillus sp. LEMMJ03]
MSIKNTLITAAIGTNGKEAAFGGAVAVVGSAISAFLGGWDALLKLLILCMIFDYATGFLGAVKRKKVNSDVMFWGGIRKIVVLVVIGLAVLCDQMLGNESPVFRTLALYFYIGREGLSIVENLGVLGVPMPAFFKQMMEQLHEKGEAK